VADSHVFDRAASGATGAFTSDQIAERMLHRRAVEAVIWGMPIVNFELMMKAFAKAGGAYNQIAYWSRPVTAKNQTLTPNPDTIYLMPFYDTTAGPLVLEIPPANGGSITGSIDDAWQDALEDVGPAGVDRAAGGKYLILPPDHDGAVPDGFIAVRSETWRGFALLRSNLKSGSDADVAAAVAYGKRVRFYPYAKAADPPETIYIDLADTLFESTIPYDLRFFQSLARMVEAEPWLTRDRAMIDPLKSLGIAKGKRFDPDPRTRAILERAADEAHAYLDLHYEDAFLTGFYPGSHWALPAVPEVVQGMQNSYAIAGSYPTDGRGVTYAMAFFAAKHLGAGQFYLMTIRDRAGELFDGAASYRLTVPADAPVNLYWSATVYDRETHALIRDMPRASRASNSPDLEINFDGSVDLWFAAEPPVGRDGNWVPVRAGGRFEVLFRLSGPEKAFFDKSWVLPDIERL
jgi:hypothetical protein